MLDKASRNCETNDELKQELKGIFTALNTEMSVSDLHDPLLPESKCVIIKRFPAILSKLGGLDREDVTRFTSGFLKSLTHSVHDSAVVAARFDFLSVLVNYFIFEATEAGWKQFCSSTGLLMDMAAFSKCRTDVLGEVLTIFDNVLRGSTLDANWDRALELLGEVLVLIHMQGKNKDGVDLRDSHIMQVGVCVCECVVCVCVCECVCVCVCV